MTKPSYHLIKQLIITRPKGQADDLMAEIARVIQYKIAIKHCPLLQIKPLDFSLPDLTDLSGIIFISGNAARYFLKDYSLTDSQLAKVKLFAVGENTADEVAKLTGQAVSFPQQMNAEGLLALAELNAIHAQKWLIVKGEGGRPLITQEMLNRGAIVNEVDVYQRKLPDLDTQQQIYQANSKGSVWLITSGEALTHLHRILGLAENPRHGIQVIVSSERLASLALQKGFVILAQSLGASEKQLVECIHYLFQQD